MPNPGIHTILTSPNGRLRAVFLVIERAPGVWSNSPKIIEHATGLVLIDLWNSEWDAALDWLVDGKARLELSRSGRDERCALVLNPETRTFELFDSAARTIGEGEPDAAPSQPGLTVLRFARRDP